MKTLAAILGCYGRLWLLKRAHRRILARRRRIEARLEATLRRQIGLAARRGGQWLLIFTLAFPPLLPSGRKYQPQFRTTRMLTRLP